MTNVISGNYRTTAERDMRAFDKLPPSARRALANAIEQWAAPPILTWHNRQRRGFETGPEIAATIAKWDREELATRESQRRNATGPYKGNARDPNAAAVGRRAIRRRR